MHHSLLGSCREERHLTFTELSRYNLLRVCSQEEH